MKEKERKFSISLSLFKKEENVMKKIEKRRKIKCRESQYFAKINHVKLILEQCNEKRTR